MVSNKTVENSRYKLSRQRNADFVSKYIATRLSEKKININIDERNGDEEAA